MSRPPPFLNFLDPPPKSQSRCSKEFSLACSRLSDSGEDAKVKGTRKVGGQFPPVLLSSSRFLNSADPTISEPGTGYVFPRFASATFFALRSDWFVLISASSWFAIKFALVGWFALLCYWFYKIWNRPNVIPINCDLFSHFYSSWMTFSPQIGQFPKQVAQI